MAPPVHREYFQEEHAIAGDSVEDSQLLKTMAKEARRYLLAHRWCPPVNRLFLAHGIGGVAAVFYVEFARPIDGGDKELWVIVGDLPSAYLVTDEINTPYAALQSYCALMDDWIRAVRDSKPLDEVFPVEVTPTLESAEKLASRIRFLRENVIPNAPGRDDKT